MNTAIISGKKFVLVPETEYRRLIKLADKPRDLPAVDFATASIGRNIVKRRKALGWTQKQLAERSRVSAEVLNRAERGVTVPSVRTLAKIEAALTGGKVA
jgi:ribosome-binding protein aMBF1 (putative translation factor)